METAEAADATDNLVRERANVSLLHPGGFPFPGGRESTSSMVSIEDLDFAEDRRR
jgi:hypothetical protein